MGPTGPTGYIFIGDNIFRNTSVGLETGIKGNSNVFVGFESGKMSEGNKNVYIGDSVCSMNDSKGSYNTFIGTESGLKNTDGYGNTFVGIVSGSNNNGGSLNTFIGNSSGNQNTEGSSNTFIGNNSGSSSIYGNSCICIGDNADTNSDVPFNQIVIGQGVTSFGDNSVTFPDNLKGMPLGTEVSFSSSGGGCLYPVSSSIRWKENIKDIKDEINTENLYKLKPVTFSRKENKENDNDRHIGLIAEDVNQYFPSLVPKDKEGLPASVKYSLLAVLILEELKKLKEKFDSMESKLNI
jgi:hypothetical protein